MFLYILVFISLEVFWFSKMYDDALRPLYYTLLLLFVTRIILLILSKSNFCFYVFWDLLGVRSFLLVAWYQRLQDSKNSSRVFIIRRLRDISVILLIFILVWGSNKIIITTLLIIVAVLIKSVIMPLSFWILDAIRAPTPISSLVHSRTLVCAGIVILQVFEDLICNTAYNLIALIAILTRLIRGIGAFIQADYKKLIALRTIRQISIIIFFACRHDLILCYILMLSHAVYKSTLFIYWGFEFQANNTSQRTSINKQSHGGRSLIILNLRGCAPFTLILIKESLFTSHTNCFIDTVLIMSSISTLLYSIKLSTYRYWNSSGLEHFDSDTWKLTPWRYIWLTILTGFLVCRKLGFRDLDFSTILASVRAVYLVITNKEVFLYDKFPQLFPILYKFRT